MKHLPRLNALRAFEAAGRHLSVSQAARELSVTPGAVSKQIKSLEDDLGVELTRRARDGLALTPEGQDLLDKLSVSFDGLAGAVRGVRQGSVTGRVTIVCMSAFASHWLIPKLSRFMARHATVTLTILPLSKAEPYRAHDGDAAIVFGHPSWPTMNVRLLKQMEFFPVCSPVLLNRETQIMRTSDLANHVLLDGSDNSHWQDWFADNGHAFPMNARRLHFQDFNHSLAAARAGLGIAMGDNVTAASDLAAGTLVRPLKGSLQPGSGAYYVLTPAGMSPTAPARAFLDWLADEAEKNDMP